MKQQAQKKSEAARIARLLPEPPDKNKKATLHAASYCLFCLKKKLVQVLEGVGRPNAANACGQDIADVWDRQTVLRIGSKYSIKFY
jgi:hypothetical protein